MENLVLIDDFTQHIDKTFPGRNVRVIEVEGRLFDAGTTADILRAHDIIPYGQLYLLNQQAKSIAAKWYVADGTDLTYWDELGISVGECLRTSLGISISRFLRHLRLLQELAEDPRCCHILIWGKISSNLVECLKDWSVPVTVLSPKDNIFSVYKKLLRKTLRVASSLGRKVKTYSQTITQLNDKNYHTRYEKKLRIFAWPDLVTGRFVYTFADQLQAEVFQDIKERNSNPVEHRAFYDQILKNYYSRAEQVLQSPHYQELCAGVSSSFVRFMDAWILENLPKRAAEILTESTHFARFLQNQQIDLLVMGMPWGYLSPSYIQVAQNMGIPVIVAQDGLLADHSKISLPPVLGDYAFALGESGKRWFEQAGFPSNHIISVGPLLWEWDKAQELRHCHVGSKSDTKKILYLSPRPDDVGAEHSTLDAYEQIELVCQALSTSPHIKLMVRFHPRWSQYPGIHKRREIEKRVRKILKRNVDILSDQETLLSALSRADIVICYPSTTAIHAAYLNKPVIVVDFSGRDSYCTLNLPLISKISDLPLELDRIVNRNHGISDTWETILKEHISEDYDLSRVISFIENIIKSSRTLS